jgi:hypothetical protein
MGPTKNIIFWDITPCSPLNVNRRFGETNRLHLQGRKNKLNKKPAWKQVARWRQYVPPKRRLKLNGPHGVISQKMVVMINTAVRTSNPRWVLLDYMWIVLYSILTFLVTAYEEAAIFHTRNIDLRRKSFLYHSHALTRYGNGLPGEVWATVSDKQDLRFLLKCQILNHNLSTF